MVVTRAGRLREWSQGELRQPRSQALSPLPPLVVGRKILVAAGHVTTQNPSLTNQTHPYLLSDSGNFVKTLKIRVKLILNYPRAHTITDTN